MKQIPIRYCSLILRQCAVVCQYKRYSVTLYFCFLFKEFFFCHKSQFFLYLRLFLAVCILFQLNCYVIYHNYHGTHYLSSRCSEDEKLVCFVLKTQGALIYDAIIYLSIYLSIYLIYLSIYIYNIFKSTNISLLFRSFTNVKSNYKPKCR